MNFNILGPLEVIADQQRLDLSGSRQRTVVAALSLSAGHPVPIDRLLEDVYGEAAPPTGRSQVQIAISSLRRLFAAHSEPALIDTVHQGYVLRIGTGELDAQRFQKSVDAAREARRCQHFGQAIAHYRDALRLWRGPALEDIDSHILQAAAHRLDEQRMTTIEDRITLELDLGRQRELIGELTELAGQFPLRERLHGLLMMALYRSERTADALRAYQQARRIMIDELGIEPGERLRKLEHDILTANPVLDAPPMPGRGSTPAAAQAAGRPMPNLLPRDVADFTGRREELDSIRQHLVRAGETAPSAVPVVVLTGQGGVGKTTAAVHASHLLAASFPDGLLFADLHGTAPHPVGPKQLLERFLRVLGVPGSQLPDELDERSETYRNLLAGRKVLIVLDDAIGESQVTPLLPGSGAAAVLVTSQRRLDGLAGAIHLPLDVFDQDKSLDLLARIAGRERVMAQPEIAAAVAAHCGHLPLALRIAGVRLAARPHWNIQQLVDRLGDETRRLDELQHGDMGIRSSILLTYESASERARRLFRRLALLDQPSFSAWVGAALLDEPMPDTEDLLDELIGTHLIEPVGGCTGWDAQYCFHSLVRVFARERLAAEEAAADRMAAIERALGALLHLAEEAHNRYYGGHYLRLESNARRWPLPRAVVDRLVSDPLSWYERERAALVLGVRQAGQAGFTDLCWSLAFSAVTLFESRTYLDDWRETHRIAVEATRKAGLLRGHAAMLYSRGTLHMAQHRLEQARQDFADALELFRQVEDEQGRALVLRHIASLDRWGGQLGEAAAGYEQALAIFRKTGDQVGAAYVLQNLAQVKLEVHDTDGAMELLSEALALGRTSHCKRVEAQVLHRTGEAYLRADKPERAAVLFKEALSSIRDLGDTTGEAHVLQGAGVAALRLGEFGEARAALQGALELARVAGDRMAEARALCGLTELAFAQGDECQAVEDGRRAVRLFRVLGAPLEEACVVALLNRAPTTLGYRK